MSQYQLIAFDMDGTLLNSNKQISPETLNAIKRATDAGKTVILCTGRNLAELNAFTEIIPGLRYLDCVSGACVYDLKEKKTLYSQALDPGIVKKLMEFGMEEGAMIQMCIRDSGCLPYRSHPLLLPQLPLNCQKNLPAPKALLFLYLS